MASSWDLVIRGGTLIDPGQGLSVRRDVAFRGGRVAEVGERLAGDATETIDATGALVLPGCTPTGRRSPTASPPWWMPAAPAGAPSARSETT